MEVYSLPDINVGEIMTKDVIAVEKAETIEKLIKKFKKYDFHSLPVVYKDRLVGICTKTDLLKVIERKLANIAATHVEDIMTPHPITVESSTHLSEASELMRKNHIRILPVVDEGRLVGLLSYSDLVKTIFKV